MNTIRIILTIAVLAILVGCSNEAATEAQENRNMIKGNQLLVFHGSTNAAFFQDGLDVK